MGSHGMESCVTTSKEMINLQTDCSLGKNVFSIPIDQGGGRTRVLYIAKHKSISGYGVSYVKLIYSCLLIVILAIIINITP